MMLSVLFLSLLSLVFLVSNGLAADNVEVLRQQLLEQKKVIESLQRRLEQLEKSSKKEDPAKDIQKDHKHTEQTEVFGNLQDRTYRLNQRLADSKIYTVTKVPGKFFPDISLIVDGSLLGRNVADKDYKLLEVPGYTHVHVGHEGHTHASYNEKRGFNLNYGELTISSAVDPYFDLTATLHISEHSTEIEEAFFNTRSLPLGFQLKAGKFLSSFGRLNSQHHHIWDFADQPLVYKVFLGEHGLLEKGIQLNWLAPTSFYLLFGLEALQGENETSFGYEGFDVVMHQTNTVKTIKNANVPNTWVGFAKTSFDIGNLTVLGGLSYAFGKSRINHFEMEDNPHGLDGKTKLFGIDLTAKYMIDSYRYLLWQSEFIHRKVDGSTYAYTNRDEDGNFTLTNTASVTRKQSGLYSQLIWKFDDQWRTGFRYDLLDKTSLHINRVKRSMTSLGQPLDKTLPRYTFMVDYNPTEFSRLRFQYSNDRSKYLGAERKTVHEFMVQFNMAIGAHGAHSF